MTANPVHHRRTKYIEIDIHFVHKKVALGQIQVLHVPSAHRILAHQYADIMTKGLPLQLFTKFRSSLLRPRIAHRDCMNSLVCVYNLYSYCTCTPSHLGYIYIYDGHPITGVWCLGLLQPSRQQVTQTKKRCWKCTVAGPISLQPNR
jgi:hypothetical protein